MLILDEINRTDLSRLLGEAFSALDDRDAQIDLPAVGGHAVDPFKLPEDLYLIGTMNTIDQSVEQLDFAMRRRFFWLHSGFRGHVIPTRRARSAGRRSTATPRPWLARHPWEALEPDVERLADRAAALNRAIAESPLLGPDYEIGHTYFFDVVGFVADQPRLRSSATAPGNYLWDRGRPADAGAGRPLVARARAAARRLPLRARRRRARRPPARARGGVPGPGRVAMRRRSTFTEGATVADDAAVAALADALDAEPRGRARRGRVGTATAPTPLLEPAPDGGGWRLGRYAGQLTLDGSSC